MTGEAGYIRILRSTKVQDGIIRIEFTAGEAAEKRAHAVAGAKEELLAFLKIEDEKLLPAAAERVFITWKKARKLAKKGKDIPYDTLENATLEPFDGDPLVEAAARLQTQPEHLLKTLQRFSKEIEEWK
jgi:alanyl-tRNA synthetase